MLYFFFFYCYLVLNMAVNVTPLLVLYFLSLDISSGFFFCFPFLFSYFFKSVFKRYIGVSTIYTTIYNIYYNISTIYLLQRYIGVYLQLLFLTLTTDSFIIVISRFVCIYFFLLVLGYILLF